MALAYINEQITTALDNGLTTIGVSIYLRKSFDAIDYYILVKKS